MVTPGKVVDALSIPNYKYSREDTIVVAVVMSSISIALTTTTNEKQNRANIITYLPNHGRIVKSKSFIQD